MVRRNNSSFLNTTVPPVDRLPPLEDGLEDIRKDRAGLRDLVAHIHRGRGIDLGGYIESTLARRVAVRVKARGATSRDMPRFWIKIRKNTRGFWTTSPSP